VGVPPWTRALVGARLARHFHSTACMCVPRRRNITVQRLDSIHPQFHTRIHGDLRGGRRHGRYGVREVVDKSEIKIKVNSVSILE